MDQFAVGDTVVVPAYGVGTITGIETHYGEPMYIINFARLKLMYRLALRVANNRELIRPLVDEDALERALGELTRPRDKPTSKFWNKRASEYKAQLYSGDVRDLCILLRNVYATDEEIAVGKQSSGQREFFENALNRLTDEIVAVTGRDSHDVVTLIEAALVSKAKPGRRFLSR